MPTSKIKYYFLKFIQVWLCEQHKIALEIKTQT